MREYRFRAWDEKVKEMGTACICKGCGAGMGGPKCRTCKHWEEKVKLAIEKAEKIYQDCDGEYAGMLSVNDLKRELGL